MSKSILDCVDVFINYLDQLSTNDNGLLDTQKYLLIFIFQLAILNF
jgi:hypothetical protein